MKKTLLIAFVALCAASTAFAQGGGSIGIFTSAAATDGSLQQPPINFTAQYTLVHTGMAGPGATGSGAAAPIPPCAGGLIITDIAIAPTVQ